ncbi:MAG: NUDIX hydrolase [Pseudomonadota bacterium]
MKQLRLKENPFVTIDMVGAKKTGMRTQFGAIPYRLRNGKPEILLVTSRRTKRWILPKGWPMDGATPAQSAAREAYEEAGVEGRVYEASIGMYTYTKTLGGEKTLPCAVMVYPLKVKTICEAYPEKAQRRRKWFKPADAAKQVREVELAHVLKTFDPRLFSKA